MESWVRVTVRVCNVVAASLAPMGAATLLLGLQGTRDVLVVPAVAAVGPTAAMPPYERTRHRTDALSQGYIAMRRAALLERTRAREARAGASSYNG